MLALLVAGASCAAAAPDNGSSCPQVQGITSSFNVVGQWCQSQQLLVTPDGTVVAEMDFVYITNKRNYVQGGDWYLRLPSSSGSKGAMVSHTRQSNATTAQIIDSIADCNNRTVLFVEIDNSAGISFASGAATTFWVFNGSSALAPSHYLLKLLATQSGLIHANEIVAYACPPGATEKAACGGAGTPGSDGLTPIGNMTTPWLNFVIQRWTFQYDEAASPADRATLSAGLAAQLIGLATSPQSLSWCASSIAAIVLLPLIAAMVCCCCCYRRRVCLCGRKAVHNPYVRTLTAEEENDQYQKMFAEPSSSSSSRGGGGGVDDNFVSSQARYVAVHQQRPQQQQQPQPQQQQQQPPPPPLGGGGTQRQLRDFAATTYGEAKDE